MGVIGGGKALYVNNKKSCGSNVLKPHCTNPRYYYICRQNKTILAQCPQNRHFESHLQKCILVPREKHISVTNGQNSDIFDSVQRPDCLKTGTFPVPDNCGSFYTCSMHGKKMNQNFYTCPKNMAYDTKTEMCKPSSTCREPESLSSCRNHPRDGKKENMAPKETVFPIRGRSETCETLFTNEEDTTTNSTSKNDDEIMSITTSYTEPFVPELTRSGDSNDIVATTERALEKSRFTNTGDFAIPITATYSTIAVENTYPTEFNLPIEVNGNKELGSTTVAGPFENGHTRIITDDPEEQSPDDQDRTAPTILDDPSMLENIERENIPGSENPSLGKQYITTDEFNEEPTFGTRNIDTEPITLADPTSLRNNKPITNLDSNKPPLEIPINDPTLQNHSTTKAFNEESINEAENTLPIIREDVTAPSRPEEQPIAEIIPTESPVEISTEEPNLENQHIIQEESSEKTIPESESMNTAPTISEDPTILNNVEAKEEPATPINPIEPSVQIPISEDPNLTDQYKAPENLSEESTTETENISTEEIIIGDPTTLNNIEPEEEPVTQAVLNESPVVIPTTENPELPITEIGNINTEPTTFINTEPEEEPAKVVLNELPVINPTTENSELPIPQIENINTEPTILTDPTTLINTEPEGEPAGEVISDESPVVIPTTENSEIPIPEIENTNAESAILSDPTIPINTEPEGEPEKEVISDESPVVIPTTENPELPVPEIENTNTEPTILTDPTTLINTEPEVEPAKEVVSNESPAVIPTTENPELPIPEIENINTETTILPDPTTLINTEPEGEPAKEVVSNESPAVIPTTENPELPVPEIENINTEPTTLTDSTTLINTEPEGEPATKVISDESPVGIPPNENSALPITEIGNINTEPTTLTDTTTLINTEPEGEPAKEVIPDESPVAIPTTENSELPIPEIENTNTESAILPDPTTLTNREPEREPAKEIVLNELPVGIPTTENHELPIPEIENINTEPTILTDPTTLINTEPEGEPAGEVISDESPVVIPTTENSELPIPEIENINTEPTILPDPTTRINTEPDEVTEVILNKSLVGTSATENPSLEKEYNNILTNSIAPDTTKPQEQPITYIIPTESFSENPEEPILEVERTVTEEFTKEPTIGTDAIGTTSAILPDALISNMTVPRETNTGTEANEPLLETSKSEEFILHGPSATPVLNDIITATKEDPELNNKGSDEQIPIEYGNGESSNYDLNRMITTDPTSLISTNGESVLQNDSAIPKINTEETVSNVITEKPDSRAMKKHSKSFHKYSQTIDKEDACNNVAQKESATTPKDIHMPSAIYYIIDKIKQCLTKILNMLHHQG